MGAEMALKIFRTRKEELTKELAKLRKEDTREESLWEVKGGDDCSRYRPSEMKFGILRKNSRLKMLRKHWQMILLRKTTRHSKFWGTRRIRLMKMMLMPDILEKPLIQESRSASIQYHLMAKGEFMNIVVEASAMERDSCKNCSLCKHFRVKK